MERLIFILQVLRLYFLKIGLYKVNFFLISPSENWSLVDWAL